MQATQHVTVLKRTGIALITIGVLDLCALAYAIANDTPYSSSVSVLAVIAGIFLVRGSLQAAAVVRWVALLLAAALVSLVVFLPAVKPLGLWMAEMRQGLGTAMVEVALGLIITAVLIWVARELGSRPVLEARAAAGRGHRSARVPVAIGIALAVALTIIGLAVQRSGTATRAIEVAKAASGPGYRYHVRSLNYRAGPQGKRVSGVVTAWNEREIKHIPFQWED